MNSPDRLPYEAPALEVLGSLSEMTQGEVGGPDSDGTFGMSGIPGGDFAGIGFIP